MRIKTNRSVLPAIALVMAGILFNCTHDKGKITPVACNTPAVVSFSQDILPLFKQNCSTSGCHTGGNPSGHLSLDASVAYANLMRRGSGYIDTVNPGYSLLYAQMISTSNPMPPTGLLSSCQTSLVLTWISQKAKNN